MSRVFDALQEAARHRGTNGTPVEAVWTELGIAPAAVPGVKVEKEVPVVRASELTALVEAEEVLEAPPRARLIPHTTDQIVVERYRMLRTKLLQEREKKFFRSLVITSASPQEGKTVTVLNLA